ncbi:MAG: methionine adenosyltransferase [Christensenellaceae bacterium]|nr:methionine adenosyltransferase [Christensenellaceae bacterium]MEA5068828.1 methionine adenosyltransferase [Christensenellaceae bacterium]
MLFSSEQVSCGHPDKICDQISDALLADYLRHDRDSRLAIECIIKDYEIILAGETTSMHMPDYLSVARGVLDRIGLQDVERYHVTPLFTCQSRDIALGVDRKGAGDQGMMFGYATDETPELLPIPFAVATHALKLLRHLEHPLLLHDAKSQVTYDYSRKRIATFLISTQHQADAELREIRSAVEAVMVTAAECYGLNTDFTALVNPTGRFVIGSSFADTGLTGRKIIADTYGGMCRHGGGAFSGKDPTKVDRSGAYMARKIACDVVRAGLARRCEVQLAYAIGVAEPVAVSVYCFGTNRIPVPEIEQQIHTLYDLTPGGIIDRLRLLDVDYNRVSAYGHFGKVDLPWEQ